MAELHLKILTPTGLVLETSAQEVVLPGILGETGILPGHTPLLAITGSGALMYHGSGIRQGAALRSGVAEIRDDSVTLLVDEAALASDLDPVALAEREQQVTRDFEEALTLGQPVEQLQDDLAYLAACRAILGISSLHE